MTRNSIIFVLASLGILVGWQFAVDRLYPSKPKASVTATAVPVSVASAAATTAKSVAQPMVPAASASLKQAPENLTTVETEAYVAELSTWGARFTKLEVKGLTMKGKDGEKILDLVPSVDSPLYGALELPGVDLSRLPWILLNSKPGSKQASFFVRVPGTSLELTKTFNFDAKARRFNLDLAVRNAGKLPLNLGPLALLWGPNLAGDQAAGTGILPPAGVVQLEAKIERERANNETQVLGYASPKWVALKNHYFVTAYFPGEGGWTKGEIRRLGQGKLVTALVAEGLALAPGETHQLTASGYAGPQDYDALKDLGHNFQRVVQFQFYKIFDWLNPLCVGLLHVLKWFYKVTGNWGVAIILLTLLVRGAMFWPSLKSMVSMRRMQTKMAAMQPRLDTLKKVYKDDPTRLNQEMMKLYKEYGVNPLGGCLPMLLQIPIFFALYGTLNAAFELRGAPFMWKWTDLTAGDPTYLFPLAMGVTMFLQQKLAPTSATMSDEQAQMQKMMLWMMPIMFTGMALFMHWPLGLLLYWTASNLFGIVQQLSVNKAVD